MTTELMTQTAIKERYGLPKSWIDLLGEPDKEYPNPRRKSQNVRLFSPRRVEQLINERPDDYRKLLERRAKRLGVSRQQRLDLMAWAEKVEIEIRKLPKFKILKKSCKNQGAQHLMMRNEFPDFTLSPNAIRALVRHTRTNYESLLSQIKGKVGCHDAYFIIYQRCCRLVESELEQRYGFAWETFKELGT